MRGASAVALSCAAALAIACAGSRDEIPGGSVAPRAEAGSDWPGFLGPHGDGRSPETAVRLTWPESGPPVRWSVEIGEGYSSPSVAAGRLFLFDRRADRARLRSLNAETGEALWSSEYPTDYRDLYQFSNGPRASPVVDGDRVYTFGAEGRLRCYRVSDGEVLWEVDTTERFGVVQNFFGVGSTPVVEGDALIVQVGGSPPDSPRIHSGEVRGNGTGIVAFDKRTGEVRYAVTDELASYSSPVVATIGGRRWAFVFARGGLVALEPATGKVDFRYPWRSGKLESVNAANPVVAGDKVLISESYGPGTSVLEVEPGGYDVVWKDAPGRGQSLRTHWMTPIHHDGFVYASHGSGGGDVDLRAVELSSGKVLWRQRGIPRSTMIYVAGHLVVLTERGELLVVEATPEAYREKARVRSELLQFPAWSPPALSQGLLYARGKDRLACFDLNPLPDAPQAARPRGQPSEGTRRSR